jgi:hypothetical protein
MKYVALYTVKFDHPFKRGISLRLNAENTQASKQFGWPTCPEGIDQLRMKSIEKPHTRVANIVHAGKKITFPGPVVLKSPPLNPGTWKRRLTTSPVAETLISLISRVAYLLKRIS